MPCVFCGRDGPLTAEHVFPRWMQPWLDDSGTGSGTHTRVTIRAGSADIERESRRAKPATLTVRSVCGDCNHGWMSRLEMRATPFLETMLRGNGRAYHDAGRTTLAAWIVKTALVAGSKFPPPLQRDFYVEMCDAESPSANTRVWLAATPWTGLHYTDFRPIKLQGTGEPMPDEPNVYSAVLAVGYFAAFVVSWLDDNVPSTRGVVDFRDALAPIWPLSGRETTWPPRRRLDFDGLDALADAIVPTGVVQSGLGRPNV